MGHGTQCVSVVGIARMVRQGLFNGPVSFRLSVPFIDRYSSAQRVCCGGTHTCAAPAWRTAARRSAANASSVTLSADVGSRTQPDLLMRV